jgi:hypothetical protein
MSTETPIQPQPASDQKQELRELRRLCRLGALEPEQLPLYWVNTNAARDPQSSLRQRIMDKLEDEADKDVQILVYGHGGSGKSTELVKLITDQRDVFFTVRFSAFEQLDLLSITAEDILVVIAEQTVAAANDAGLHVSEKELQPIYNWFAQEEVSLTDSSESSLEVQAEAGVGSSALSLLAKLMASIKSDIKLSSDREHSRVLQIRQRPSALVNQVNLLVDIVRGALPADKRLLIIVEDTDKLDIEAARRVFIENVNLLTSITANIIYTIPIFTFHSPDAQIMRNKFDACLSLPMIKVAESNGTRAAGFDIVHDIIRCRIWPRWLNEEAAELLITKTGGVLQHVFEVLNTAASMTTASLPLGKEHIEYGLQRKTREFYSEITLPYGGIPGEELKVQDLYDRLAEHARVQLKGEENPPKTDAINQVLLKCCALVEYNGKSWYGVHPLVMDILRDLGLLTDNASTDLASTANAS